MANEHRSTQLALLRDAAARLQQTAADPRVSRLRPEVDEGLRRLRDTTEVLVPRIRGDRVEQVFGCRIGGVRLGARRDVAATQAYVDAFYAAYGVVFGAGTLGLGELRVMRVRPGPPTAVDVQQHLAGVPVLGARWTLLFDHHGDLSQVTGAPVDPTRLQVAIAPTVAAEDAVQVALRYERRQPGEVAARASLVVDGASRRLLWAVRIRARRNPEHAATVYVDAHSGEVSRRASTLDRSVETRDIPVTHYSHPGGAIDSTGHLATHTINIDAAVIAPPPKVPNPPPTEIRYSLQRLGPGRTRIWNAKQVGLDTEPVFEQTVSTDRRYFTKTPGNTSTWVFNEQQTYFWAQTLKSAVDRWGREPNAYGHYPVDPARAVMVEVVVNGDACMEEAWGSSVNHGFFLDDAPGTWFGRDANDEVPSVYLFNSAGNAGSAHFFGPERSSSYAIVAHEVGHFISWQYGNFDGPSGTVIGRSLREGFSMVLPLLFGKEHFGGAFGYADSGYETNTKAPLQHTALDGQAGNPYTLATPFAQAMWRLMNDLDINGRPIWGAPTSRVPTARTSSCSRCTPTPPTRR
jgi:hypothetical protein